MFEQIVINSQWLEREIIIDVRQPKKPFMQVLFAHDSQNLFFKETASFGTTWGLAETLEKLEANGYPPTLVIGFRANNQNFGIERLREYSLFDNNQILLKRFTNEQAILNLYPNLKLEAKGKKHLQFLMKELIPAVTTKYQIANQMPKYIIGSSMGGLMSLTTVLEYQQYFTGAYCLSNAFWYCESVLLEYIQKLEVENSNLKLYLDTGTNEAHGEITEEDYLLPNRKVVAALKEKFEHVVYQEITGGEHHENSWSKRLELILTQKF
ncbi:MAG: alpha/beta hydrolase [Mycoplasmatales bacterium]